MKRRDESMRPKNGRTLRVLQISRISTLHQDEKSLKDQEALYDDWLNRNTEWPREVTVIASQGSGECLDREEYLKAIKKVESGKFDLVISEDLGRVCRRVHAHIFCEMCVDAQTRLIALNDHVDTAREDWYLNSYFAVMRHESYNRDTSQRIRRSLRNRFSQGGVFQCVIYGYIKPEGAKSDQDVQKDPEAEAIYDHWFAMLEDGASFSEVADWLNEQNVPTGRYCNVDKWDGAMVARVTRNPILKGLRLRNQKMAKRVNSTGRRKCVKAPPEELLEKPCPHLAFIEPERYDRVIRMLDQKNSKYRRRGENGCDTRANVPKQRTRWPGQHIYCGICGRLYVFGGHGQTDHLMCNGAREHKCWNGITVDGPLAASKLSEAIMRHITDLPDFDATFLATLQEEWQELHDQGQRTLLELAGKLERVERQIANVLEAISDSGGNPSLIQRLQDLEEQKDCLLLRQEEARRAPQPSMELPSMEDIRRLVHESLEGLAVESPEYGRALKRLIPRIVVFPHCLIDGGQIVLRARFRLDLTPFAGDFNAAEYPCRLFQQDFEVDIFDPPQREEFRERVVSLRAQGHTERRVAEQLDITHTAAQRAAALQRQMDAMGLSDPYVPLTEPPDGTSRLKRHKHPRYRFEPLDGAGEI